ncbi:MAG: hypothetical protein LC114_03970 [Bryobacterales bacterium]|nr:hypothetical protein [Bryobacterales bacterium]
MNAASYADDSVAAGEMIVIFGTNLGPDQLTHLRVGGDGKLVNALEGVQVFANGLQCPLIYVSKYQLSALVPYGVAQAPVARFQVVVNGVPSNLWDMPVTQSIPGIFTVDASGKGQAAMTNSDGNYNSSARPANPGNWITFYLTGEGPLGIGGVDGRILWDAAPLALPVKVRIAGYDAQVLYAGSAPGNVNGFAQINAIVPPSLPYGGDLPLSVEIGGVQSRRGVTVAVAGPAAPKPSAPILGPATLTGNDTIRLSWSNLGPSISSYFVERADDGGAFRQLAEVNGANSFFEDTMLGDGSDFRYRVRAGNEWGMSEYSGVTQITSIRPSLSAPSAFKANAPTDTSVALSWVNNGAGATEIVIEKSTAGSAVYQEAARIPITNAYVLGGLSPSMRYSFRIRASGPNGISRYSNVSSATTLPRSASPPPVPSVSVSLSPVTTSLRGGQSQQFIAAVQGSTNSAVTWSISPSVGSITNAGVYTAPPSIPQTQVITVTARSAADTSKTATALVTLTPPEVISLSINPSTVAVKAGQTQGFTIQLEGSAGSPVTWSLTPNIGTITVNGTNATYTAPASVSSQQSVQIQVRSVANPSASAQATVTLLPPDPVVQISVTPTNKDLRGGETQTFAATVTGASDASVTWSRTPAVGTLTQNGTYTAPAVVSTPQTVLLTARSVADPTKSVNAVVNLMPPEVTSISINPTSKSLQSGQSQAFSAQITGVQGSPVTWSLNPNIGTLNANGTNATYTAPASVTAQTNVQVTVRSTSNPSASATAVIALTPDPPATYSISGRVTGSPATLSLSGPVTGTTTTNGSGDYTFTGVTNGVYVLSASRTGYSFSPSSAAVTIASASVTGINFTGTALPPTPRRVLLSWNSSPSPNVIGYNIYRAKSSAGPYSKITPTPVASTSYTDENVSVGNTYYYYATAIDSGGLESANSNQAMAPVN